MFKVLRKTLSWILKQPVFGYTEYISCIVKDFSFSGYLDNQTWIFQIIALKKDSGNGVER